MSTGHSPEEREAVLSSGRPLSELARLFPRYAEALEYYAKWAGKTYGRPTSTSCELCARSERNEEYVCTWETTSNQGGQNAVLLPADQYGGQVEMQFNRIEFPSHHVLCASCAGRVSRRNRIAQVLHYLFFVGLVFGVIGLLLCGVTFYLSGGGQRVEGSLLYGSFALFVGCWLGLGFERRFSIPEPWRKIGRSPFKLRQVRRESAAA